MNQMVARNAVRELQPAGMAGAPEGFGQRFECGDGSRKAHDSRRTEATSTDAGEGAIAFGCEYEIALGQAVDLVRPDFYADLAPGEMQVGMVVLLLGDGTDA